MKKIAKVLSALLATTVVLSGCASKTSTNGSSPAEQNQTKLVVGATPVPSGEILQFAKPLLKEKGINLEIKEFSEYVTPNVALNDKQLDANYYQHTPFLDKFNKDKNMNLVPVEKIHFVPMGGYSKKAKSKDELKNGAEVAVPNDPTNEGRALLLLQQAGLIKLKDEKGLLQTPKDIIQNPKNLKFKELEAAQLPRVLPDVDLAVIPTNFALQAGLNPPKDSLFIEDKDAPFAIVVAARPDNKENPAIKALIEVLTSDKLKKFIDEKYNGSVLPAF